MIQLNYNCQKVQSKDQLASYENSIRGKHQFSPYFDGSILNSWQFLMNYLQPGKAADGTIALYMQISNVDLELTLEEQDLFTQLFLSGLVELFGERNILSVVRDDLKNGVSCSAIVFPLVVRSPNADHFLNSINQTQPTDKAKQTIERRIGTKFSIFITGESEVVDDASLGYMPALINYVPAPHKKEEETILIHHVIDADSQVQTVLPYDQINKITNEVISYFTFGPEKLLYERALKRNGDVTQDQFMEKVMTFIKRKFPGIDHGDLQLLENRVYRAVFQNYILEPLIDADEISDIMVLAPDNIRVKIGGERYTCDTKFINESDYFRFISSLATRNNLDPREAIHVFSDTVSNVNFRMRLNITTPYINSSSFPYLHIRKIAKKKRNLDYLYKAGMLDQKLAEYLIDKTRNGKGIVFTGKGGSGKTTLMNMLLDYIPFDKSGLVIQESEELFSDVHPHLMFEHVVLHGNGVHYDLQSLAQNGLLTDLDYFVIGEIKGAEAKYFLNAADTGHKCWCSVHSSSSVEAIDKLADYVMYETKYSKEEAMYMLKNLGTVVFMSNFKIMEISEVTGWDNENKQLIYTPIYMRPSKTKQTNP